MLAASLGEISAQASNEKSARSSLAVAALTEKAPSAVAKLRGLGGLVSALTVGKISAIAVHFKTPLRAGMKASVAKQLGSLTTSQPSVLAAVYGPPAAPAAAPAAAPVAAAPGATATGGGGGYRLPWAISCTSPFLILSSSYST